MCNPVTTRNPGCLLAKGEHNGFEYEVVFGHIGFRCGYVRVPYGHPWHGRGYDEVYTVDGGYPEVHGGLTFAEPDTDCGKGGEDNAWWLGFDCGHYLDAPDPELPGYNAEFDFIAKHGGVIRTTEYVIAECRKLADQAAEMLDGKMLIMCCVTHAQRDRLDIARGIKVIFSESEHFRCRCGHGMPCERQQTQPDLLCDWCRGRDHFKACSDIEALISRGLRSYRYDGVALWPRPLLRPRSLP